MKRTYTQVLCDYLSQTYTKNQNPTYLRRYFWLNQIVPK